MITVPRARLKPIMRAALLSFAVLPVAAGAQEGDESVSIPLPAKKPDLDQLGLSEDDKAALSPDEARGLFKQHQRQLGRIRDERTGVKRDVADIEAERARLNTRLLETARKARKSEERLTTLEKQMAEIQREETALRNKLREQHREIADLLAAMQRMGREPPPVMVTQREDALAMVRSGMILNNFFPALKARADALAGRLSDLTRLLAEKRARAEALAKEKKELDTLRARTRDLIAERQKRLKRERARLSQLDQAADRHTAAIADLSDLLARLDGEVAKKTGLGDYERQLKSGDTVELSPSAKKAAFVQPGRMKPAVPFAQSKGLLTLPASGTIVRNYGETDKLGLESKGMSIRTRSRAQVVSPADGWVSFAGRFRSYGQLLIINAGGGYHILLAGMAEIHVRRGQFVLSGEPVATMGSKTNAQDDPGKDARPSLYVEFRKDKAPIDPEPWWAAGLTEG